MNRMKYCKIVGFLLLVTSFYGCSSFMYGYTEDLAFNSYYLVKSDKKDFGNRRIRYNMGHHKNSELYFFLLRNNNPDFIHEYENETKCDVIELFYVEKDSVFIFEEPKKLNVYSVLRTKRKMDEYERRTYGRLNRK